MAFSAHKTEEELREHEDTPQILEENASELAQMIKDSKHFIIFTGAGISTSAGIPDFRGPDGIWTLRAQGRARRGPTTSTLQAIPTPSHMSIVKLQQEGICKFLISQNTDGLHRRSGIDSSKLSELHGNSNLEKCRKCGREYLRDFHVRNAGGVHDHDTGRTCSLPNCGGMLHDTIINFGESLPRIPLENGFKHSELADLCLVLGSSLTVTPAANMPMRVAQRGKKLVVCNLQKTPLDSISHLRIYSKCDDLMKLVMQKLNLEIPEFELNRRMIIKTTEAASTTKDYFLVTLQGIEKDGIPASFLSKLELKLKKNTLSIEPRDGFYSIRLSKDFISEAKDSKLNLQFMGNYAEPSFEMDFDPFLELGEKFLGLKYSPFTRVWKSSISSQSF